MKIVKCDICGDEIETRMQKSTPQNKRWLKLIIQYVGETLDAENMDLCLCCYLKIWTFIELLKSASGNITVLLSQFRSSSMFLKGFYKVMRKHEEFKESLY